MRGKKCSNTLYLYYYSKILASYMIVISPHEPCISSVSFILSAFKVALHIIHIHIGFHIPMGFDSISWWHFFYHFHTYSLQNCSWCSSYPHGIWWHVLVTYFFYLLHTFRLQNGSWYSSYPNGTSVCTAVLYFKKSFKGWFFHQMSFIVL